MRTIHQRALPVEAVRDLLGLVRALYRAWHAEGPSAHSRLADLPSIGIDLRMALDLALKVSPGTIGHSAAIDRAEAAAERLGWLVTETTQLKPVLEATVQALLNPKRRSGR